MGRVWFDYCWYIDYSEFGLIIGDLGYQAESFSSEEMRTPIRRFVFVDLYNNLSIIGGTISDHKLYDTKWYLVSYRTTPSSEYSVLLR